MIVELICLRLRQGTPATEPELIEGGDVGYRYALSSQNHGHSANYLADAIELGKDNTNNFYLKHAIYCLSLLKVYAPRRNTQEPYTTLSPVAKSLLAQDTNRVISSAEFYQRTYTYWNS